MNKGLIRIFCALLLTLSPLAATAQGEIYKVVDEDGNVTFTDQRPSSDAVPMDLPPLSVIQTDPDVQEAAAASAAATDEGEQPLTVRELRRKYRDFRIITPENEQTFWGTANTVAVTWGSSETLMDGMSVRLSVNGETRDVEPAGSAMLTLDRGEHQVYAELRDARNRRIVTTETVTFFVKQHSVNFNRPRPGGAG